MIVRARQLLRRLPGPRLAEGLAFAVVLALCVVIRLYRLGTVPRVILGDETDNLQSAYKIVAGTGPGIFGYDWKPAPLFSLYPLAWCIRLFGDSVTDFRMFPVILSLLTIVCFYLLARQTLHAAAALPAMAMLGTNLWFLHFSRTAWENVNAALFATGACWCFTRAVRTQRYRWWAACGAFTAFGLYGYFSGRFIFISVAAAAVLAVALRQAPLRRTALGLAVAGVVAGALFAPQAWKIAHDWDAFTRRTDTVSVFRVKASQSYLGDSDGWVIAAKNAKRNFRGFVLQDAQQTERGLWGRYNPAHRTSLDQIATYLFWAGLAFAVLRWRRTYAWWPFFIPLIIVEVFSTGTPDLARGIVFAPFYFLFIGLALDEAFQLLRRMPEGTPRRAAVAAAVVCAGALVGRSAYTNVRDYLDWQDDPRTQVLRLPGVDVCDFPQWQTLAREAAKNGALLGTGQWEAVRDTSSCPDVRRDANEPPDFEQPTPQPGQPTRVAPTRIVLGTSTPAPVPALTPGLPTP